MAAPASISGPPARRSPTVDELAAEIVSLWHDYRRTRRLRPLSRAEHARRRRDLGLALRGLHARANSPDHFRRCMSQRKLPLSTAYRLMAAVENSQITSKNAVARLPRENGIKAAMPSPPAQPAGPRFERAHGKFIFHFDPREAEIVRRAHAAHTSPGMIQFDLVQRFCAGLLMRAGLVQPS